MALVPLRVEEFRGGSPAYIICRTGNRSGQVVMWLARQGIEAINVHGGIVAWEQQGLPVTRGTRRWGASVTSATQPQIEIIDTPNLGDRSYVVALDGAAVVVDPQRDIDRVRQIVEPRGWRVTHVVETHVHNDYVSGGRELATRLGAVYVVPRGHDYAFEAAVLGDGDTFESGRMHWEVVHTRGIRRTMSRTRCASAARTWLCSPADRCCTAASGARI